jgi:flavin-dependent dehydrogenase
VVGAGTAGAVTALLLARRGHDVTVVERSSSAAGFKVGEGMPSSARPLLARLGLLDVTAAAPHVAAYTHRSAWGSDVVADFDFIRTPHGQGFHLDRAVFDASLLSLAQEAGAVVQRPAFVHYVMPADGQRTDLVVHGSGREWVAASQFIVDATGRGASIARRCGARRTTLDRLLAFCSVVRAGAGEPTGTTLVESFADGWWYTADLPHGMRMVMMLTDPDLGPAREARSREGFGRLLSNTVHVSAAVGGARLISAPTVMVAGSSRLTKVCGQGWLAVGDAALAFDPLSSQGIMTAIYSAERAAQTVERALHGDPGALDAYTAVQDQIFDAYRLRHRVAYTAEPRWTDQPFWDRRRSMAER